ncbi:proline--tRNA ligase, partial [Vibrio parahaemolyticus V-223/04]
SWLSNTVYLSRKPLKRYLLKRLTKSMHQSLR